VLDQLPELPPRERIDTGGRFVQDQQVGIVNEVRSTGRVSASCRRRAFLPVGRQRPVSPVARSSSSIRRLRSLLLWPKRTGEEIEIFGDRQRCVEIPAQPLRHIGHLRANRRRWRMVGDIAAKTSISPDWITLAPATKENSEDLPTPSGPIKPTMQPDGTSRLTPSSASVFLP